jgi:hypothetical protein
MTITTNAIGSIEDDQVHKAKTHSPKNALKMTNFSFPSGTSFHGCFYAYSSEDELKMKREIALARINSPTPAP